MRIVVQSMVDAGYITEAEARAMKPPALDVRTRNDLPTGTYFADWALPEARELTEQGYERQTLTTTLDSRLQNIARQVTQRAPLGEAQVALVAMRRNGEVVAMIGGKDYAKSPFNRVTQAKRQPGSTFKLFVYLAALRAGWSPADRIANSAITEGSYRPKNSRERYSDSLTLEEAFAQSSNVAAVRLLGEVGSEKVIATARDLGVRAPLPEGDPSLALGTSTMTLLELTSAYAAVAANEYPVEPHAFARPERGFFENLWDGPSSLSSATHSEMERMLRAAINKGTGRAAMLSGPNFGKTGTTQDNRELFVGYAGDLVVGVWIGNDDNSPLQGGISGGRPHIWRDFMNRAMNVRAAPSQLAPREQQDPGTPIEPLDVPDWAISRSAMAIALRIRDGEAVFSTEIDGTPVDISIGDQVAVDEAAIEEHGDVRTNGAMRPSATAAGTGRRRQLGCGFCHQHVHDGGRNRPLAVVLPRLYGQIRASPAEFCNASAGEAGAALARGEILDGYVDRLEHGDAILPRQFRAQYGIACGFEQPAGCTTVVMVGSPLHRLVEWDGQDRRAVFPAIQGNTERTGIGRQGFDLGCVRHAHSLAVDVIFMKTAWICATGSSASPSCASPRTKAALRVRR